MSRTALIITCYNWSLALQKVLSSVSRQTVMPDEIVIADDGSRPVIQETIQRWQPILGGRLKHVWQPDDRFRAARSRNLALIKTACDHLVMIDGDCLLPPSFIEQHQRLITDGVMVAGGRYLLSKDETSLLLNEPIDKTVLFDEFKFLVAPVGPVFRDRVGNSWRQVRTCNLGVNRADLLAIGGFDENYIGWGKEDSDLVVRLMRHGVRIRSGRLAVCVKHLYHQAASRQYLEKNTENLARLLTDGRCLSGERIG